MPPSDDGSETYVARRRFVPATDDVVAVMLDVLDGLYDEAPPPLYDYVDPDALQALFTARPDGGNQFEGTVSFGYDGLRVRIDSDGVVTVVDESP